MGQQHATDYSKNDPATFSNLQDDVVPAVVEVIRSWAEKEETGQDWREKLEDRRR